MLILSPSAAQTATSQSSGRIVPGIRLGAMHVNVSAVSGTTPTLEVKLQESADGINWADLPSFTTALLITTGLTRIANPAPSLILDGYIRAVWTIGGTTPSFTFTVLVCDENNS